jgi:hypothetical protein
MRKIVNQADTEKPKITTEETFIDGFDYVECKHQKLSEVEKPCSAYASSFFTGESTEYVIVLFLIKKETLVRYVVLDSACDVYLMSNEGKTIERIN